MQRIATSTKAVDLYGVGKHGFKDGNLTVGITPTDLEASWCNGVQEELVNLIEVAGLVASGATLNQIVQAIAILQRQQTNTAFTTTGVAPNFVLTPSLPVAAYAANQRFRVNFNVAGSGANAINVSALGAKLLKQYDGTGAKVAAVIAAGQLADIEYDGVDFVILDPLPSQHAGEVSFFARNTAPTGYLKANGAAVSVLAYLSLTNAIYVGDPSNPTALFGYRCLNADGSGRSTVGMYIVLPDIRGEFIRGWDDGRGLDAGRAFGTAQVDDFKSHTHLLSVASMTGNNGGTGPGTSEIPNAGYATGTGGAETRPHNVALLACIKY